MTPVTLQGIADKQVLYLTTIGRTTDLPREIESWFVVCRERFYLFAETEVVDSKTFPIGIED
jgi:hypothetical protein